MKADAEAAFVDVGAVAVGETPHVVEAQDRRDVVDADARLHVGGGGQQADVGVGREAEKGSVVLGIVALREMADEPLEGNYLAQLQLLDERDAVEEDAVAEIAEVDRGKLVHGKLHGVEQGIRFGLDGESNLVLKHEKKKNIHLIRFIEGENREKTER